MSNNMEGRQTTDCYILLACKHQAKRKHLLPMPERANHIIWRNQSRMKEMRDDNMVILQPQVHKVTNNSLSH